MQDTEVRFKLRFLPGVRILKENADFFAKHTCRQLTKQYVHQNS